MKIYFAYFFINSEGTKYGAFAAKTHHSETCIVSEKNELL